MTANPSEPPHSQPTPSDPDRSLKTPPDLRKIMNILALVFGGIAVFAGTVSFTVDNPTPLLGVALIAIISGLILARVARRQPPPVD